MSSESYPCPLPGGAAAHEYALAFDQGRKARILVVPALFDEANKLRHLTVETMRRLHGAGIDCFLPDLPGTNESLRDLAAVELEDWRMAVEAALRHFGATHVLAIRGGALLLPSGLSGWLYAPVKGASLLKTMLRARILASREAGIEETGEELLERGLATGLELAGFALSGEMIRQLQAGKPAEDMRLTVIEQELVGGRPLWLRAEPDHEPAQADALAAVVSMGCNA